MAPNGARELRERIARTYKPAVAPQKTATEDAERHPLVRRAVKLAVGLVVAIGLGWSPLRALFVPASVEAVVNARIVTVRAPIEGRLEDLPPVFAQWSAASQAPALEIANPDADRAPLAAVNREIGDIEDREDINARERVAVAGALAEAQTRTEAFRAARLSALQSRLSALSAEADAATARAAEADEQWRRERALRAKGVTSAVVERHADAVAQETALFARSATFKLAEVEIERDALAKGAFVGDAYNDTPNSAQAVQELKLKLASLDAQADVLAHARARTEAERERLAAEYARLSRSKLDLPAAGRVFEILAAPGERIVKGQDILRVVDCASAIISADVEESVYNRLKIGQKATFAPADGSPTSAGRIVNLTGASAAPGVYAISPASLRKSPFYVSIAIPQAQPGCDVGRTGNVTFDNK